MEKLLLTENEAAKALGLQPRTLQAWRHRGGGPAYVRISARCIRYAVSELEAWAKARTVASTSEAGDDH